MAARDLAVRPWRSLSHSKVMLVTAHVHQSFEEIMVDNRAVA